MHWQKITDPGLIPIGMTFLLWWDHHHVVGWRSRYNEWCHTGHDRLGDHLEGFPTHYIVLERPDDSSYSYMKNRSHPIFEFEG